MVDILRHVYWGGYISADILRQIYYGPTNGDISTSIQRQKLLIDAFESSHCSASF